MSQVCRQIKLILFTSTVYTHSSRKQYIFSNGIVVIFTSKAMPSICCLVGCFGFTGNCPLRQCFGLYRPSPKEREKEKRQEKKYPNTPTSCLPYILSKLIGCPGTVSYPVQLPDPITHQYYISLVTRRCCFSFQSNPKDLDPSCKTDLDLWDCLGRVKLVL